MRGFKRIFLLLGLVVVVYLGIGWHYASYRPERSDNYLWGAYHVHSVASDGLAPLSGIAEEARKARVAFVLLTDHGRPNLETSTLRKTIRGVRFIGGSESGLPEGHLNFFGADTLPRFKLPPFPPAALEDIHEWGGFGILTYPDDPRDPWRYWEGDFIPDGIEILNITSYFRRASIGAKLATALVFPFSPFAFLKNITSPAVPLNRWDTLLKRGKVLGFYACNAHGGFALTRKGTLSVPVPSYATTFSLAGLAVPRRYRDRPEEAVRKGDFFSVLRGAGEPQLFELTARLGDRTYPAGSSLGGAPELVARVETLGLEPIIVVKRDGKTLVRSKDSAVRLRAAEGGVYRAEVYLKDHPFLSPNVPWILSNPIFVNANFSGPAEPPKPCDTMSPIPLTGLRVEKDEASTATYEVGEEGASLSFTLSKATPDKIDRWVALASRGKRNLAGFDGFYVEAVSKDYMRYQVEIRSGEKAYYSSFKLYPGLEARRVVPFSRFYATFGEREPIPLEAVDSLFITVNTWSSVTGLSSALSIRGVGFCRQRRVEGGLGGRGVR